MTTPSSDVLNTLTPDSDEDGGDVPHLPLPWAVVTILVISVAIVTAVGGNVLVLLCYCRDPCLRRVHNLYLLHLAVCDLLVGVICMPLYLVYTVRRWNWPLGVAACRMFLVVDLTLCTMTTVAVVLVAWDRLAMFRYGAAYKEVETRRKAYLRLGVGWLFSFLLYSPAILLWDVVTGVSVVPPDDCDTEYNKHLAFTLLTELINFFVPFVSLSVLHVLIFVALRQRLKIGSNAVTKRSPKIQCGRQPRRAVDRTASKSVGAPNKTSELTASSFTRSWTPAVGVQHEPSELTASSSADKRTSAVGAQNETELTVSCSADKRISAVGAQNETELTVSCSADKMISAVGAPNETLELKAPSYTEDLLSAVGEPNETSELKAPSSTEDLLSAVVAPNDRSELKASSLADKRTSAVGAQNETELTASSSADKRISAVGALNEKSELKAQSPTEDLISADRAPNETSELTMSSSADKLISAVGEPNVTSELKAPSSTGDLISAVVALNKTAELTASSSADKLISAVGEPNETSELKTPSSTEDLLSAVRAPNNTSKLKASSSADKWISAVGAPNETAELTASSYADKCISAVRAPNETSEMKTQSSAEDLISAIMAPNETAELTASRSADKLMSAVGVPNETSELKAPSSAEDSISAVRAPNETAELTAASSAEKGNAAVSATHETSENLENTDNLPLLHIPSFETCFDFSAAAIISMTATALETSDLATLNYVRVSAKWSPLPSPNADTVSHLSLDTCSTISVFGTTPNMSLNLGTWGLANNSMSANRTNIEKYHGAREEGRPRTDVTASNIVETNTAGTRTATVMSRRLETNKNKVERSESNTTDTNQNIHVKDGRLETNNKVGRSESDTTDTNQNIHVKDGRLKTNNKVGRSESDTTDTNQNIHVKDGRLHTQIKERHSSHTASSKGTRVAVMLTGLVLALAICWLPYCVTTVILAACPTSVNNDVYEFFNWLLWFKSCLNPLLYAYASPRFRLNIRQLLARVCPRALSKR